MHRDRGRKKRNKGRQTEELMCRYYTTGLWTHILNVTTLMKILRSQSDSHPIVLFIFCLNPHVYSLQTFQSTRLQGVIEYQLNVKAHLDFLFSFLFSFISNIMEKVSHREKLSGCQRQHFIFNVSTGYLRYSIMQDMISLTISLQGFFHGINSYIEISAL